MTSRRRLLLQALASLTLPIGYPFLSRAKSSCAIEINPPAQAAPGNSAARPCPTLVLDTAMKDFPDPPWASQLKLRAAAAAAKPAALRYPGSDLGDYWDWNSGWIDPACQNVPSSLPAQILTLLPLGYCHDLADLRLVQQPAAADLFYNANLLTKATPDLLNALRACAAQHMPVKWVSLGDDLAGSRAWLDSLPAHIFQPWDESSGATPYPATAAKWAADLHAYDPDLRVAAFATGIQSDGMLHDNHPCVVTWNTRLVENLKEEAHIHALAFAVKLPGGMGLCPEGTDGNGSQADQQAQYALLHQPPALRALFNWPATALQAWLDQPTGASGSMRQQRFQFWVQSLRVVDPLGALRYTWAHGLLLASALNALYKAAKIELVVLHNAANIDHSAFFSNLPVFAHLKLSIADGLDEVQFINSFSSGERTAAGWVFASFTWAQAGAATATALDLAQTDSLVFGWVFQNAGKTQARLLLANLTETPCVVNLARLPVSGLGGASGETLSARPETFILRSSLDADQPFALHHSPAVPTADGTLNLPAYSLTLLTNLNHFISLPVVSS